MRTVCDSIKIKKLIVCERNRLLPGRLEHTGEVGDMAEVFDLNLFFVNPILLKQMGKIPLSTAKVIQPFRSVHHSIF